MASKEILPQQTYQADTLSSLANFATKSVNTPAEYYENYKFDDSSSEGMSMDETYLKPKGDN